METQRRSLSDQQFFKSRVHLADLTGSFSANGWLNESSAEGFEILCTETPPEGFLLVQVFGETCDAILRASSKLIGPAKISINETPTVRIWLKPEGKVAYTGAHRCHRRSVHGCEATLTLQGADEELPVKLQDASEEGIGFLCENSIEIRQVARLEMIWPSGAVKLKLTVLNCAKLEGREAPDLYRVGARAVPDDRISASLWHRFLQSAGLDDEAA